MCFFKSETSENSNEDSGGTEEVLSRIPSLREAFGPENSVQSINNSPSIETSLSDSQLINNSNNLISKNNINSKIKSKNENKNKINSKKILNKNKINSKIKNKNKNKNKNGKGKLENQNILPKELPNQILDRLINEIMKEYSNDTLYFVIRKRYWSKQEYLFLKLEMKKYQWFWTFNNPFCIHRTENNQMVCGKLYSLDNRSKYPMHNSFAKVMLLLLKELPLNESFVNKILKSKKLSKKCQLFEKELIILFEKLKLNNLFTINNLNPFSNIKQLKELIKEKMEWNSNFNHLSKKYNLLLVFNGYELTNDGQMLDSINLKNNSTIIAYFLTKKEIKQRIMNHKIHETWNPTSINLLSNLIQKKVTLTPQVLLSSDSFRESFFSQTIPTNKVERILQVCGQNTKMLDVIDSLIKTNLNVERAINLLMDSKSSPFTIFGMNTIKPTETQIRFILTRNQYIRHPNLSKLIAQQTIPTSIQERINEKYFKNKKLNTNLNSINENDIQLICDQILQITNNNSTELKDYINKCLTFYKNDKEDLEAIKDLLIIQIQSAVEEENQETIHWNEFDVPPI